MRISFLQLNNFKSYKNCKIEFPPLNHDKNIVVIGGLNGYGKTSILEAIYLCLYGAESILYLGRAGLNLDRKDTYSKFITRSFNANTDYDAPMSITIEFVDEENEGFNIKRTWYFDNKRIWDGSDEVKIFTVENGIRKLPQSEDKLPEILDKYFVPSNLAPFFFFDGEEVKSLATKDKIEQVKTAIENFLGIVLLRQLQARLREFQRNRSKGISQISKDEIDALFENINNLESTIYSLKTKEKEYSDNLININKEFESIQERMLRFGATDGSIANIEDLVINIRDKEDELNNARTEFNRLLSQKLSINLVSKNLINIFLEQIQKEKIRHEWDKKCNTLKPQKEKFLNSFFANEIYTPPLVDAQKEQIRDAINSAWESLFSPPPPNCAKKMIHTYMSDEILSDIEILFKETSLNYNEIITKLEELHRIEHRLYIFKTQLAKLEGSDKNADLFEKLKKDMDNITEKRDACMRELTTIHNNLTANTSELNNLRAQYERECKHIIENEPTNSIVKKAEDIYKFIDILIPNLYALKMKSLEKEMTNVFIELSHKQHVKEIKLDDDATAHLLNNEGKELDFDKSAGESQIFATTLLSALANFSTNNPPLVVDTPLGRLDSQHREKILHFWTKNKNRQVILLSHDKEIDKDQYFKLKKSILISYTLEHVDMGHGIGQSSIREGYFNYDIKQ